METKTETKIDLTDWLGGEHRQGYSGRGMFGKTCDAWEYEYERNAVIDMMASLTVTEEDEAMALLKIFKTYQIDSMGMGVILYFPTYKAPS